MPICQGERSSARSWSIRPSRFSLAVGLSIADTTVGTLIANLGFDKVVTPKPTFIGDTVTCATQVVEMRESKSRPGQGIVTFKHELTNQRGEIALSMLRTVLLKPKPAVRLPKRESRA
jgi:acyl dehydratase